MSLSAAKLNGASRGAGEPEAVLGLGDRRDSGQELVGDLGFHLCPLPEWSHP